MHLVQKMLLVSSAKFWELVHLLFIGFAVSYALFCRRNFDAGIETHTTNDDDDSESYVSRVFRVSSIFKDGFDNSCGYGEKNMYQTLNSENYKASESLVDTSTGNSAYFQGESEVVVAQPDCSLNQYGESGSLMDHKSLNLPIRSLRSGDRNRSDGSESNSPSMGLSNSPYVGIDNEFGDMDPTNLENRFDETDSFSLWNWLSRSERMDFGGATAASCSHLRPLSIDETQFESMKLKSLSSSESFSSQASSVSDSPNGLSPSHVTTEFMASSFSRKVEADFRQQDIDVFFENIYAGFYDTALRLVQHDPELAVTRYINDDTALHALARKPSAYASRSRGFLRKVFNFFIGMKFTGNSDSKPNQALELLQCVWKEIMRRQDVNVADFIRKPSDLLFNAAKLGDFELLGVLLRPYPDLVGELDENLQSIFHVAVLHRRVKILKLICELGIDEKLLAIVDNENNSLLHLAAKYWPSDDNMYGAELKMQRELLFFKEVETMVPPSLREMKNAEGVTPRELFSIEHKRLLQWQQQHMRRAAKSFLSCVIFFAPVTLGALFVIPRNINETIPLHVKETLLQLYTVSDATAFFSSCLCILVSLWIIMSSHEEIDSLVFTAEVYGWYRCFVHDFDIYDGNFQHNFLLGSIWHINKLGSLV
ncbi:hypothetical protein Ddye_022066 [Dipteronia dyeriana]|uniref:Ankyrin repeat-containing protein n=1 Tax=Dipteronia dyeriana TaxID=168575 RepID=A0AAD9U2U6_9ROSI|nr:hypothetical protein Ddye_022066 [Dipteronia dyeriana]